MNLLESLLNTKSSADVRAVIESKTEIIAALKELETDDYQGRKGNYPKSGKPDTIEFNGNCLEFSFKNTAKGQCIDFVEKYLKRNGLNVVGKLSVYSDGDYADDWNVCVVELDDVELIAQVDLPGFLNDSRIAQKVLTDSEKEQIVACCKSYLEYYGDGVIKEVEYHNSYLEFTIQNQYGPEYSGMYGVMDKDGLPDVYNENSSSCILDFMDEMEMDPPDAERIRKGLI